MSYKELAQILFQKQVLVFDLDDTLNKTKEPLDQEMLDLLSQILEHKIVAITSGAAYKRFQKDITSQLKQDPTLLKNLYLYPTCATRSFRFHNGNWEEVYAHLLSTEDKLKIQEVFPKALSAINFEIPKTLWGEQLEDRHTQMAYSHYGQEAPRELKEQWDPNREKRVALIAELEKYLPHLNLRAGGTTTIDITHKGIDKAFAVEKMHEQLEIPINKMFFIGDSLMPGGNDHAVLKTGIQTFQVKNCEQTKEILRELLQLLQNRLN